MGKVSHFFHQKMLFFFNLLHIFVIIGPVPDAKTGFRQVDEHEEADFAFIHDSAEVK